MHVCGNHFFTFCTSLFALSAVIHRPACTYDSLRDADVISGCGGGRLVRPASVAKDGQLLRALNAALAQTSKLNPISSHRLIRRDYEIVTLT